MKNYLMWFLLFASGVLIGSWWPQSELSLARERIEELEKKVASNSTKNLIPEMAKMIAMPADAMPSRPSPPRKNPGKKPASQPDDSSNSEDAFDEDLFDEEDFPDDDFPSKEEAFAMEMEKAFEGADSAEEALETMADLWKTRRNMAREALADNLGLSDSELDDFDFAMDDMNDELARQFANVVDTFDDIEAMEEPSPEDAFRLAHAFTGVFVDTYDDLDNTLPDGWREDTESPMDLTAFIDPYVFKPMLDFDSDRSFP